MVNWLVKVPTEDQMGECERKGVDWLVEVISEREMGE